MIALKKSPEGCTTRARGLGARRREAFAPAAAKVSAGSAPKDSAPAPVLTMDMRELTESISGALQEEHGSDRHAVDKVSEAANCNQRAAENWLYGKNAPDALHLLRLIATSPAVQAEVRRLTAMDAALDPMLERDLVRLIDTYRRRLARGEESAAPRASAVE